MAVKDEMYKMIVQEIEDSIQLEKFNMSLDQDKVKAVAKMLTGLSVDRSDANMLINQYIAQIKNICK